MTDNLKLYKKLCVYIYIYMYIYASILKYAVRFIYVKKKSVANKEQII